MSKPELLKLVSVLEGELQARDIVIAVLKSEQLKRLLAPSKQPIVGSGFRLVHNLNSLQTDGPEIRPEQTVKLSVDPISSLARDSFFVFDPSFDHATTLSLYNFKMFQLENLINSQRSLRNKLLDHLKTIETRYEQILQELEIEKSKAREIESLKLDKDKYEEKIAALNKAAEEHKNQEKEMVLTLLHERKQLIVKLIEEHQQNDNLKMVLSSEKGKIAEMVEGLEDESKRSLQMEAELEKYMSEFQKEKENFEKQKNAWQAKSVEMQTEIDGLKNSINNMHKQLAASGKSVTNSSSSEDKFDIGEGVRSSIVTMSSNTKVHSYTSVSTVAQHKASVAQPIAKAVTCTSSSPSTSTAASAGITKNTQEATSESKLSNAIFLPPPSIKAPPQPTKQPLSAKSSAEGSTAPNDKANVIEPAPSKEKVEPAKSVDESGKVDHSVKQNILFYENSVKQQSGGNSVPVVGNVAHSTATMKKANSLTARVPPPVPPNKPLIRPLPPSQAIMQSKTGAAKANSAQPTAIKNSTSSKEAK